MKKNPFPPKWITLLLERYCDNRFAEGIMGDLDELYNENHARLGVFKANWLYMTHSIGFLRPRFSKKLKHSNFEAMFRNYLIITYRNLTRHAFYSVINVFGLAIGMAAGFMILQYVYYELTYDQFFENKENIYRVQTNRYNKGELSTQWAAGAAGVGLHLYEDFPEVINYVNMSPSSVPISYDNEYYEVEYPYYVRENFFEVFSVPLIQGVDSLVLKEPFTVVLSNTLAKRIFGDEDPVGKILKQRDTRDFKVTGVFKDLPERSHMKFDLMYSFESLVSIYNTSNIKTAWQWDGWLNYVVLQPGTDPKALSAKFPEFVQRREGEDLERQNAGMEFVLQPLTKIHLTSDYRMEIKPTGDENTTYFLLIIGMFVLFIAWINYINLTTARSLSRAKEVGIRKVMGSQKGQLIRQFMFESVTINFLAFVIAALLVISTFPFFNDFVGRSNPYTWPDAWIFWLALMGIFMTGIVLSGFYPAIVLSKFKPVVVLKGRFSGSPGGNLMRKGLVIFQFLASIVLITGTYVVFTQMNFLNSQDLGVNIDKTLIVEAPSFPSDSIYDLRNTIFQNEISNIPFIQGMAASTAIPGRTPGWNAGGIRLLTQSDAEANQYRVIGMDDQFMDLYGLDLVTGRTFDNSFGAEEANVVINESALRTFGLNDPEEILGREIYFWGDTFSVVGVVKDYRHESPKQAYDALIFRYFNSPGGYFSLNVNTNNLQDAVTSVNRAWETAFNNKTFNFFFLDDYYNEQYEADVKFGSIFGWFAGLAIFVACLGLFGLASYITSLRSKEVGIRKVLGATLKNLWILLTSDFIKLVGISILISLPLSWWIMKNWLDNFALRIDLGIGVFAIPALLLVIISVATVSYHTFKTAHLNPASTLKDE